MNLLAHARRALLARSSRTGDWAEDDGFLDAVAFTEETRGTGPLSLAALPATITGGRVQWDAVLRGVPRVVWEPGWERRGAPVMVPAGILWHWTAGAPNKPGRPAPSLRVCVDGRPDVPGPLCHLLVAYTGTIHVIAAGRANHAGRGHQALLDHIRAGRAPAGTAARLGLADTGGAGGALIGVEIESTGKGPLTLEQTNSVHNIAKACRVRLGLTETQAIGWSHIQWTRRKIDLDPGMHTGLIDRHRRLMGVQPLVPGTTPTYIP